MTFKFNPGDLVRVKHVASEKTPSMVIVAQSKNHPDFAEAVSSPDINYYICRWYYQGDFKMATFREEELDLIGASKSTSASVFH